MGGLFFYAKNCRTNFSATAPYYINRSDNFRIYKMKVDGSNVKNINNEKNIRFNIINNYLYYITGNNDNCSICKIKNDGTDKK